MLRLVLAILLSCSAGSAIAGGGGPLHDFGAELASDVQKLLVRDGVCSSVNMCQGQSRVLFSASSKVVYLSVHAVSDPTAVGNALAFIAKRAQQLPSKASLRAEFHSTSQAEDLKRMPGQPKKVFAKLEIQGQYAVK
jgi:hypothetical protein